MPRWTDEDRTPLEVLRVSAGFTRDSASSALGVSPMTLYRYEKGVVEIPLKIAREMAKRYQVTIDEILSLIDKGRDKSNDGK